MLRETILLLATLQAPPIPLAHKFSVGERRAYRVEGRIQVEVREPGAQTWIPEEESLRYDFSYEVEKLLADGGAQVRYKRPTMTVTQGETYDSGEKVRTEKLGIDLRLQLSTANEVVGMKNLGKEPSAKGEESNYALARGGAASKNPITEFIQDAFRLSLFMGSVESALDLAPKFPVEKVKVGDTWKRTVSYQPQKLAGKDGKIAVQRLDYEYTYLGPQDRDGKKVERVRASIHLSTDLAAFYNQAVEADSSQTGLEKLPLRLDGAVDFDLDPTTLKTLGASAKSTGGFEVYPSGSNGVPVSEIRFKGETEMTPQTASAPATEKKRKKKSKP